MATITQDLLSKRLKDWTLSCKVKDALDLSSMDDALFKKELLALKKKGFLEETGVRRGLKFRYKAPTTKPSSSTNTEEEDLEEEETEPITETEEKQISDIASYLQQRNGDKEFFASKKTFKESLSFICKASPDRDPSILSYTYAIKHTKDGFILRVYSGVVIVNELTLSKEQFIKYLKNSGITLDD